MDTITICLLRGAIAVEVTNLRPIFIAVTLRQIQLSLSQSDRGTRDSLAIGITAWPVPVTLSLHQQLTSHTEWPNCLLQT